jgi:hypothetical protein
MKNLKSTNKKVLPILFLRLFLFTSSEVHSQIGFPDDVGDETPAAPIDGLLGLGLAAGAWYGIKKLKAKK